VVNWHDRSLAPERLWTRAYATLLAELRDEHRVWFATAGAAVEWYRWRRAIRFVAAADGMTVCAGPTDPARPMPAATLTVRNGAGQRKRQMRLDPAVSIHTSVPAVQAGYPWQLKAI
jgi:hypothetical protein